MAEKHALIPDPTAMYTQTQATIDAKDLSKNLVSGDFEKQYRAGLMEKPGRWRGAITLVGVFIAALAFWLLILTVVQQVQIGRLTNEIDQLTINVMALEVAVQRCSIDVFKGDAVILTDDTDGISLDGDEEYKKPDDLVKMYNLTEVLPSVTEIDDDMYDEEEADESGDYYMNYDTRRTEDGISSMVKLQPDDFSSFVKLENTQPSQLMELTRQINANPEDPNIGVPTFKDPMESVENRHKRSVFPDSSPEEPDQVAVPKSITKDEERRKTKKFDPSADDPMNKFPKTLHSVTRTVRSDGENSNRRPFIAAHFHGNTSHLNVETHEHYKGNGLVRVAHDHPHDVWYPSRWTAASPHPRPTLTRSGHVHVHHTGVYLVYVQIYYLDSHDITSWVLHRSNPSTEGREALLQCARSAPSVDRADKPNSCFSAAALLLRAGDRLAVRNTGGDRHSLMQPDKSFIGLVKLADSDDPADDEL